MKTAAIAAALVTTLAASAGAQQEPLTTHDFLREAVQDNVADVEIGRMVRNEPSLPQGLHQLGESMARSSTQMNGALAKLAQDSGTPLGSSLHEQDRQAIQRLSQLQGQEFVREYLSYVMSDLDRDIQLYQDAIELDDPNIRQFAQETLPVLQTNYAMARQVWNQQVAQTPEDRVSEQPSTQGEPTR